MSDKINPDDPELELNRFVDGELPPVRAAEIAAAIERDPSLRHRVEALCRLKAALGELADPLLALPMPERLTQAALGRSRTFETGQAPASGTGRSRQGRRWRAMAVAASLAAAVVMGVFIGHERTRDAAVRQAAADPLVAAALAARDGEQAPLRQVSFPADTGTGAADRFVASALGGKLRAPDLSRAGFTLVAGDLYEATGSRAVQLRYIDADRHLFTVYLHRGAGPDRFALVSRRSVRICVWQNQDMGTVMSAELPTPELFRLASMTYSALAL